MESHYRGCMATPDFILDLRAHVGTSLLWIPGCTAVVIKEEGEGAGSAEPQILVVRRADNLRWTLVTGIPSPQMGRMLRRGSCRCLGCHP